ncbi:MAG: hypothetical protein EOO33_08455 [Comamonadaceae bacterium]|nr:MAG: hypothetical protein EOO33_08455 [Comamonadaceae bacterium]
MNALLIPTIPRATPRRPGACAALTGIAFALVSAASGNAWAQTQQTLQTPQTAAMPFARAEPAPPPGRTRAEVIAELECARASGELAAAVLHSYGLSMAPQPQSSAAACGDRAPAAIAGRPASTAKN